jgi:N-acetylglucosaminyl-diphospho-decaprenol L-rhamnosyltransferase
MTIDVLIVGFRNAATIERAISSLELIGNDVTVAVHDNSPEGETLGVALEACRRMGYPSRAEHCPSNCGYGRGLNSLAAGSRADTLLILNPDACITRWSLRELPSGRAIVGPRVVGPDGRPVVSWGPPRTVVEDALLKLPLVSRVNRRRLSRMEQAPRLGFLSGVAMLVPRAFFEELGGFDPGYFLYYEDVDLGARAVAAGGTLTVSPDWSVAHVEGHSWRQQRYEQLRQEYLAGRRYFGGRGHARAYDAVCTVNATLRWAAHGTGSQASVAASEYRRLLSEITASRRDVADG